MTFGEGFVYVFLGCIAYATIEVIVKAIKEVKIKKFDNSVALEVAHNYINELEKRLEKKK